MPISDTARRQLIALQTADEGAPIWVKTVPLVLDSRANTRGRSIAYAEKAKTHRTTGRLVAKAARLMSPVVFALKGPLVVRIVRQAPRLLDDDNAVSSAKSLRDGIADGLGVDDRDSRVTYVVDQEKSKTTGVLVEFYRVRGGGS